MFVYSPELMDHSAQYILTTYKVGYIFLTLKVIVNPFKISWLIQYLVFSTTMVKTT
jgi:hypothetical protein